MQGGNIRASINVDLNLGDALGEINKLKSGLKQLKIPANATKGFENSLDNLVAEIQKFDSLNKNIKPGDKAGMNALEKSYQNILRLAQKVDSEMASMGSKGKSLISDSDLAKMNKLKSSMEAYNNARKKNEKEINSLKDKINKKEKERIEGKSRLEKDLNDKQKRYLEKQQKRDNFLAEKNNKKLYDYASAKSPSEKAKITNQINKTGNKQEIADLEKLKSLMKEVSTASKQLSTSKINFGNFNVDKISQEITELQGQLKQLQSAGGSLDQLRSDFAALAGVPLEKVTTDVEELSSEIKSLQTNKIEQLKTALNQLGSSNGINKLNQDLRQGQQQLNQYRGEFDKLTMKQRDADDMKYRLTNFFSWSEGLNLLKRGAREAFRAVKDLDDAMTGTAVVTDFSVSDLWDMLPKYTETANKLGATVQGAYETMTLYYQQGLDTEAAFGMGTETMKMSRIADMDYVEGTDLMTAAIRGFHMDLTETSAKWVNDVYSELAAISASDTHEIATAMTKTASIADSANAEFDTTAAFLTQMIETTREAPETAGTALKTIIARFQELKKAPEEISDVDGEAVDANKIEAALRTIDVDLRDTTGQFRSFDDVILDISNKWDSLDTNTQRYIATVAAGARQQSRFIALVADNERLTELVEGAQNSAGASDKQFEKTMESLTAKLNTLKNAYHEFLMGILDSNVIKGGVDALTGLFNILNNLADLTGPLGGLVKVLMAVGMFMGGRSLVMNGISAISGGLTNAIAAGTAAGGGAGAAGIAAAMAASKDQREEDKKQKKASKKAGAMLGAGKQAFLGTAAGQLFSSAFGNLSGLMKGDIDAKTFGTKAKTGAKGMGNNALGLLGALAFGTGFDADFDKRQQKISDIEDRQRRGIWIRDDEDKKQKLKTDLDNDKKVKGLQKRSMALNKMGTGAAGALASVVDVLGAIPGPAMAVVGALGLVVGAFALNAKIEQDRVDKMNELVTQHNEAKQAYETNKASLIALENEYKTLSKGVSRTGENIGLSAEQFERYQEISQEIADISPEAVESVDIEGNVILKPDAIQEALDAVEYDMQLQDQAFASSRGLETLLAGTKVTSEDIKEGYFDAQQDLNEFLLGQRTLTKDRYDTYGPAIKGQAGDFEKQTGSDLGGMSAQAMQYEVTGPAGMIKAGSAAEKQVDANVDNLSDLYNKRYEVLKDAKENLTEIAKEYGVDSDEYQEAIGDYYDLTSLIDQADQMREELIAERQPIVDSLKEYAQLDRNLEAAGIQSLADNISKENESLYNRFIEDTALNDELSASEMHNYIDYASEKLGADSDFGKGISEEFDSITEAKEKFDQSARDTEAINEYNDSIEESVTDIEGYIQQLRDEGTDQANALADSLEAQLSELKNYAQEAKMTMSEAFNDMSDEISEANKAKEKYDAAIAEGDYYTGRQSFKAIYDDITSDLNFAGDGSQSFWAGAEMMLDQQWLRENAGNVDAVKAKVKSLNSMMQDGVGGAQAFTNQLYKMADNLSEKELADLGLFFNEAGELDFENFKDENITALAEKLGLSVDFTTAMLNNLRQFSDINFSNIDDVVRTMKDTGVGVETSGGKMAVSRDALYKQSGMTLPEFQEWAGQESTQEQIILVDYQLKDKNSLVNFAKQMEEIAPSVFSGEIGKDATTLKGERLSLDDYIAASHMLGATQEEATSYLEELSRQGVKIDGKENGESIADAVADGYEAINLEDPLVSASDSMNNASNAMMALVGVLGGPYNEDYANQTKKEVYGEDGTFYDSGKKDGTASDFQAWTNADYERAQQDRDTALALQQQNQAAAEKAAAEGRTVDAERYQADADMYGRRVGAIDNTIDQHTEYDAGRRVNINGEWYDPSELDFLSKNREGMTAQDVEDEYNNRNDGRSQFSSAQPMYANEMREDLSTTGQLGYIGEVGKANLEIEIANAGGVEELIDNITELTGADHEVVLDALTAAAEGDVTKFNEILADLPPETQAEIISKVTGIPASQVLEDLNTVDGTEVTSEVNIESEEYESPVPSEQFSYINYMLNGLPEVIAETQGAIDGVVGSPTANLGNAAGLTAQVSSAVDGPFNAYVNAIVSGLPAAKGMNRPAINYGSVAKGHLFGSAAKGHTEGIIGPRGNGGMTLTGELGPELVWLPSQNASFMVGEGGPQLVPLPSDAVVYPAHITKNIVDQNRPVTEFGSMGSGSLSRNLGTNYKAGGAGTSDSSVGAGNASKAGTDEDKWKNEIDWLYNLLEDINEVIRDREKLEHRYEMMLEKRNASLSELIDLQNAQLENLRTQKALEEERLEKRMQEMREYLAENSKLASDYGIKFNEEDMTIEINWDAIDAIKDEEEGEKVNDMISRLEEIQDEIDEAEDSLMEIEELVAEIEARGKEEFLDLEGRIIDALESIDQQEIDRISEISDSISDGQSKLLESIQKSIDKERQKRENQKTEENLGDMRRRLAYLRQDTSGMNDLEIKQLEEQLKEEEEAYGDTLIDQKLQEMQDQNDEASAQRERQIAIMEEQLKWNKESGHYADQARQILVEARNDLNDGKDLLLTALYQIISQGENWQSKSDEDLIDSKGELNQQLKESSLYLDNRNNENYMEDMQEWTKVILDPKSTNEDKAEAVFEISQLETQRNLKLNEEEKAKIYGTSTDTAYTDLARDLANGTSVNYMDNMQNALASGDLETLQINEDLRNKKLQLTDKSNEQTNFYEQALKAKSDEVSLAASGEKGYVDYMQKLEDALKIGDFDQAYYWELMRDKKLDKLGKYSEKTGGSITLEAMKNWTPTQQQTTQQQQPTQTSQTPRENSKVKVKSSAKKYSTGQNIPNWVKGSTYTISRIKDNKALLKEIVSWVNLSDLELIQYAKGGLAKHTGPAWLDGTPSKPELVLNARDTENFIQLKDILADLHSFRGKISQTDKVGDTYYDVQINVEKIANDYDVEKMAEKIKKIIHKDSMYRNVNAINFLR